MLALFVVACTKKPINSSFEKLKPMPTMAGALADVEEKLPAEPSKIPQANNWAVPMEETADSPAGILLSEEKATQCLEYVIRYDELRGMYRWDMVYTKFDDWERDRQIAILEASNTEMRNQLHETWLDRNRSWILVTSGFVLGGFTSYGFAQLYAETITP